jgi:hypothetical protein
MVYENFFPSGHDTTGTYALRSCMYQHHPLRPCQACSDTKPLGTSLLDEGSSVSTVYTGGLSLRLATVFLLHL